MAQQWAKVTRSVTRALILHLAHIDVFSKEELDRTSTVGGLSPGSTGRSGVCPATAKQATERSRRDEQHGRGGLPGERRHACGGQRLPGDGRHHIRRGGESSPFKRQAVPFQSWSGDNTTWLQVWRRVLSLLGPSSNANAVIAVDAISQTIQLLLAVSIPLVVSHVNFRPIWIPWPIGWPLVLSRPLPRSFPTVQVP